MKKIGTLLTLALSLFLGSFVFSQVPADAKHHAVIAMTAAEGPEWGMMIRHVQNLRAALATDGGVEVEVVFYGAGLRMLLNSSTEHADALKALADEGVVLAACQNAMAAFNVKSSDLLPFAVEVDAGVAEVVRKQTAGWSYLP